MSGPEARLEQACCALARRQGWESIKLSHGAVGLPDRLYLRPGGGVRFVEFKSPAGRLTPRQRFMHLRLAALGHRVAVIRSVVGFKKLLAEGQPLR